MGLQKYNDSALKLDFINDNYFDIMARRLDYFIDNKFKAFPLYERFAHFMTNDLGFAIHVYNKSLDDIYYTNILKMFNSATFFSNTEYLINKTINKSGKGFFLINWDEVSSPSTRISKFINYFFNTTIKNYIMSKNTKINDNTKLAFHDKSSILMFYAEQI